MGLAECSSSAHMHTRSWHLARDPLFKHLTVCRELVHRQDEICERICEAYASTPCNILYTNVSTTGQSSNMSNTLLNSVPTLNGSNSAEWLPAMEAYLMSQGIWGPIVDHRPIDPKTTAIRALPATPAPTQAQRDAAAAGVEMAALPAVAGSDGGRGTPRERSRVCASDQRGLGQR